MLVETGIGPLDQRGIETFPRNTGLVIGDEENARSNRIEGEGHPPDTIVASKRSSFMLACFEPLSVSAPGRLNPGPATFRSSIMASNSS